VFDHVTIRVADRDASERFYDTVLRPLAIDQSYRTNVFSEWNDFTLAAGDAGNPPTRRLHIAFVAPSREHVDAFWRAGTEAGYADRGAPGLRPLYADDYYGAFLLDPDGNSAEAVHDSKPNRTGIVDHLWIRVPDVARAKRFYETIAPHAGIILGADTPERAQFSGAAGGSFSLIAGAPGEQTEHVHIAFPTNDNAVVDRFHEAATAAGYASNGPPGERPRYHPGYYAAFVFDPDGNNIEVVNHNRH
jgi:catechol 2,3-dioxygenase-like lactoylglutathione lyase family enzyme